MIVQCTHIFSTNLGAYFCKMELLKQIHYKVKYRSSSKQQNRNFPALGSKIIQCSTLDGSSYKAIKAASAASYLL